MIAIEALDALGVALASHNHRWSERERSLFENAIALLTSDDYRGPDLSALVKRPQRKPLNKPRRYSEKDASNEAKA